MQWFSVEALVKDLVNAAMLKRYENRLTYHNAIGLAAPRAPVKQWNNN
jgi:hypothetical protein